MNEQSHFRCPKCHSSNVETVFCGWGVCGERGDYDEYVIYCCGDCKYESDSSAFYVRDSNEPDLEHAGEHRREGERESEGIFATTPKVRAEPRSQLTDSSLEEAPLQREARLMAEGVRGPADQFKFDVFLSHSSNDKRVVRELAVRLQRDGLIVWFDEWVIKPGDSIPSKIDEGLDHSRVLVLCMSANAFGSDWSQLESQTFRFRDPLNLERRFIPLRLDNAPIKGSLAQFRWIDWRREDSSGYERLKQACLLQSDYSPTPAENDRPHVPDFQSVYKNDLGRSKVQEWGRILCDTNQWNWHSLGQAIEHYRDAVKADPLFQQPWTNLAYAFYVVGRIDDAAVCLEQSLFRATKGANHPGTNHKRVAEAIATDTYISDHEPMERPQMPDWFAKNYGHLFNVASWPEKNVRS